MVQRLLLVFETQLVKIFYKRTLWFNTLSVKYHSCILSWAEINLLHIYLTITLILSSQLCPSLSSGIYPLSVPENKNVAGFV